MVFPVPFSPTKINGFGLLFSPKGRLKADSSIGPQFFKNIFFKYIRNIPFLIVASITEIASYVKLNLIFFTGHNG